MHRIARRLECPRHGGTPIGCGGRCTDQHGPGAAGERAAVGPPERPTDAHRARQVARVVGDIECAAQLICGSGEELGEEGDLREGLRLPRPGRQVQPHARAQREDREYRDQQVGEPALRGVYEVVSNHGYRERNDRESRRATVRLAVAQSVQGVPREHLVEGVVPDITDQGDDPHQQRSHITELRTRLDHLR